MEVNKEEELALATEIAMGAILPMTLKAAIELGLFGIIASSHSMLSSADIAARLETNNPDASSMLDRILRLLATHSLLTCSLVADQRLYGLGPLSKYFCPNQDGPTLTPLVALFLDKVFVDSWYELKDSVLQGGVPFDRAHGMHAFAYLGKDARFNKVFNAAMVSHSTEIIQAMLHSYDGFRDVKELVDVGGGLGVTLSLITAKYPHVKAINYDLPHVIDQAPHHPCIKHVGGDMFESVPQGDAIFMKSILHDWDDEYCIKILKNCYKAIPEDGKVIIMDKVVPEEDNTSNSSGAATRNLYKLDMMMMTQHSGGKERTRGEFTALATTCGFTRITFACSISTYCVIELFK